MLEILFERGWIDPTYISKYLAKGRSDHMSSFVGDMYSVDDLMKLQTDLS